jgi:hypothetical protein
MGKFKEDMRQNNSAQFMNYTKTSDMGLLCYQKCDILQLH